MSNATVIPRRKWSVKALSDWLNASPIAQAIILGPQSESWRQLEFLIFSVIAFAGKSALLIRMPYRTAEANAVYTLLLLLLFYGYYRFRHNLIPPQVILFCLAGAVAIDVLGNYFQLYGQSFGPVMFDEFAHFTGAAFSLPPTMWLLRMTMKRFGYKLPSDLIAFLSVTVTFSFCAYYEILELWDEQFFNGKRLWTPQDSANDLQMDLAGIIIAALISSFVFRWADRTTSPRPPIAMYPPVE